MLVTEASGSSKGIGNETDPNRMCIQTLTFLENTEC